MHKTTIIMGIDAVRVNMIRARLEALGGTPEDWITEWGGDIADYFGVRTSLAVADGDVQSILDNHAALTVAATKASITADGVDPTVITCTELATNLDYSIWRDGTPIVSGSVADGSIEFSTDTPGSYLIEIQEQGSNRTGYIEVEAV